MRDRLPVLIVDDSEDDALLVERELRRSGFEVEIRRVDTRDAMAAALAEQPWKVILADYRMPGFGGQEALTVLVRSGLDIPFIVVSGTIGEETAVSMMKSGAHDFVLKHNLGRLGPVIARELREAEVRQRRRWAEAALELSAEAGKLAIEAGDFDKVVLHAAEIVVPRLADWCIEYARGNGAIGDASATAAIDGVDRAALTELAQRYLPAVDARDPWLGEALTSRTPLVIDIVDDDRLVSLARDARHRELLCALRPRSLLVIPQLAGDQLSGVLVLGSQQPGRYEGTDQVVAIEVAGRVALVLENARLFRAREEFISTAVHEIKTPIAVIKTSIQLMQELSPEERQRRISETIERIDRQCHRLQRIVTEVLEVSRLDLKRLRLHRRPTDLTALIDQVVGEMRGVSPRHQLVIARNDPVTVDVDADRIEQVLTNLLANAVKYSPAGSQIEVEAERRPDAVAVCVRDHGIGIPQDKQQHIFERFYRAHAGTRYEHATSLGVGLYLSREFVQRHGGQMSFESQEGVGSTFCFSLPIGGTA